MGSLQMVDRVASILDCFDEEHTELGLSEIAARTGLSKAVTHRLLASLVEHGFVERELPAGRYGLGPHLLRLAHVTRGRVTLESRALPLMRRLRDRFDETVGLHVLDSYAYRRVVAQVESRLPLRRTYTEFGQAIPIHLGGPGKVLLAYHTPEHLQDIIDRPLPAATTQTLVDPDVLRRELADIRSRGYARCQDERIEGVSSVAAPIVDHTGSVRAAMNVTGPSIRLPIARLDEIAAELVATTRALSLSLGAPATTDLSSHPIDTSDVMRGLLAPRSPLQGAKLSRQ